MIEVRKHILLVCDICEVKLHCSCAVNDYTEAVKEVACEILELAAEGLWVPDKSSLSKFIRDVHSDSLLRINHYPPVKKGNDNWDPCQLQNSNKNTIGFGEHSDPQILTILRSNNVGGLQISTHHGLWIPVPPEPNELYVMVGDALQVTSFLINSILLYCYHTSKIFHFFQINHK